MQSNLPPGMVSEDRVPGRMGRTATLRRAFALGVTLSDRNRDRVRRHAAIESSRDVPPRGYSSPPHVSVVAGLSWVHLKVKSSQDIVYYEVFQCTSFHGRSRSRDQEEAVKTPSVSR